jgi:hypothetical protein
LDKGADIHAQGGRYANVLQAASYGAHERMVELLLDNSADVHAQGGYFGNALQAASCRIHERIVQLLVDNAGWYDNNYFVLNSVSCTHHRVSYRPVVCGSCPGDTELKNLPKGQIGISI